MSPNSTQYPQVFGDNNLQLAEQLQQFADAFWLHDHVSEDQAAAIVLDAFKRKVAGQLELLDLTPRSS